MAQTISFLLRWSKKSLNNIETLYYFNDLNIIGRKSLGKSMASDHFEK